MKEENEMNKQIKTGAILAVLLICVVSSAFASSAALPEVTLIPAMLLPPNQLAVASAKTAFATPDPAAVQPPAKVLPNFDSQRYFAALNRSDRLENALFTSSLIAMAGLNAADYFSTRKALSYPGTHEANPLMKPFVKNATVFAAVKIGSTALTCLALKKLYKRDRMAAWVLSTASNFLLSYVVANNMKVINQARNR